MTMLLIIGCSKSEKAISYYEKALAFEDIGNSNDAFKWYKKAAEAGNIDTMYKLGLFFYRGIGTQDNDEESFNWYKKAAEAGHVKAMHEVGLCYLWETGVAGDTGKALEWFKKAADAGDEESLKTIQEFLEAGGKLQ